MKILTIVSLILIAAFGAFDVRAQDDNFSSDSDFEELYEYKPNPNRVGLKATFDDRVVGDLLNFVPAIVDMPKNRTIISSLLLSKVESFKSEAVSFRPRTAMLEGGDLLVAISPSIGRTPRLPTGPFDIVSVGC